MESEVVTLRKSTKMYKKTDEIRNDKAVLGEKKNISKMDR